MSHPASNRFAKLSYLKRCAEAEMKEGNYAKAAEKYNAAIALLNPKRDTADLRLLYSNRSLVYCKANRPVDALQDATAAVQLAPGWAKGHWRQGKALGALGRWPEALHAFLKAYHRAAAGSNERDECEQQTIAAACHLTRQQVADMLIDVVQQQQQQQQQQQRLLTGHAVPLLHAAAVAAGEVSPAAAAAAAVQAKTDSIVPVNGSTAAVVLAGSSSDLIWQQQQQEMREAMFQIIKAQQSNCHSGSSVGYYQTLLIRALLSSSSSSSSSGSSGSSSSKGLQLELKILSAKVAVKLKRWAEAQSTAAAAAGELKHLVLKDPEELLYLLLECYTVLGDAYMAGSSSSSTHSTAASSSSSSSRQQHIKAAEAAKAYLTALDLLPDQPTGLSIKSNKSVKLPPIAAASAAARQQQLYSNPDQTRNHLKSKLTAVQEQLSDTEHAAVWLAAAAAAPPLAAAAAAGGSGQKLAIMQLGLAEPPADLKEPLMLVSVNIRQKPSAAAAAAAAAAAVESGVSLNLSGPQRVQLLSGIARLAGVGRLAVGLTSATVAGSSSSSSGSNSALTITVQLGPNAAAADRFMQHCSSISKLTAACPELQEVFGLPVSRGSTAADPSAAAAAASMGAAAGDSANAAAAAAKPVEGTTPPAVSEQQQEEQQQEEEDSGLMATAAAAAGEEEETGQQLNLLDQLYCVTAELCDLNAPQQQQQQQQQQPMMITVGSRTEAPLQQQGAFDQLHNDDRGVALTPAAAAAAAGNSSNETGTANQLATTAAAAVVEVDQTPLPPAVIPMPYAHYSLVTADGRPVERPDKHPFALTRVIHDQRDLPSETDQIWYQSSDLPIRWRQTASEIQIQVCNIPDSVTSAKQLEVAIEPYSVTVTNAVTNDVYLEGDLARGIVPEDSTWTFSKPAAAAAATAAGSSKVAAAAAAAAAAGFSPPSGATEHDAPGLQLVPAAAAAAGPLLPAAAAAAALHGEGRLVLYLAKMNLELFERPWQHSASWWPKLFTDDPDQIAWDDESKDYTDLPAAVAAAHQEAAAAEEQQRRVEADRRHIRERLQGLLDRHKRVRQERLRELKAKCYGRLNSSSSSSTSSTSSGGRIGTAAASS